MNHLMNFFSPEFENMTNDQQKAVLSEMVSQTYIEYSYVEMGKEKHIRFGFGGQNAFDAAADWELGARMNPNIRWLRKSQTTFQQLKT